MSYLHERENGEKLRADIVRKLETIDSDNDKRIRFLIRMGSDDRAVEDVIAYTELCDIIEEQHAKEREGRSREGSFT